MPKPSGNAHRCNLCQRKMVRVTHNVRARSHRPIATCFFTAKGQFAVVVLEPLDISLVLRCQYRNAHRCNLCQRKMVRVTHNVRARSHRPIATCFFTAKGQFAVVVLEPLDISLVLRCQYRNAHRCNLCQRKMVRGDAQPFVQGATALLLHASLLRKASSRSWS